MCVVAAHWKVILERCEQNSTFHSFCDAKLRNIFNIKSQNNLHCKGPLEVICSNPSLKAEPISIRLLRALTSTSCVSLVGMQSKTTFVRQRQKEGPGLRINLGACSHVSQKYQASFPTVITGQGKVGVIRESETTLAWVRSVQEQIQICPSESIHLGCDLCNFLLISRETRTATVIYRELKTWIKGASLFLTSHLGIAEEWLLFSKGGYQVLP